MNKKISKKTKTIILLDAHAIIHRAYHALPDFSSPKGEPTGALYGLVTTILKTIKELKPDYIISCFDVPEPTYRHKVFDEYKAGRAKADEALIVQLKRSKDVFKAFGIPIYEVAGYEADDVLGTIVEKNKNNKNVSIIIASGDMDTMQLVDGDKVKVLTMRKGIKDTFLYNERAVVKRFGFPPNLLPDFKGLRGDPSDNIPGIRGVGDKTATDLVSTFGEIEKILKIAEEKPEKMKKHGIKGRVINLLRENREEALFSKMLATITRDAPIEFSLPVKTWEEDLSVDKVMSIFSDLGFRSLKERFYDVLNIQSSFENTEKNDLVKEKHKELIVATWLLNSELTQPKDNDILDYFKSRTLSEAYLKAMKDLKDNDMEDLFEKIEKPLISIIEKMTERGINIDTKELEKIKKEYKRDLKKVEKKILNHAGRDFNINSPLQMGRVLFEDLGLSIKNHKKTSTGVRSTRESELVKLKGEHPIIDEILEYREISKIISTYIEPILSMIDKNKKLHAEFVQTGTTTGRISSNHPNLQNIPISSEKGRKIRDIFVVTEGFTLVSFDYSQIDLRVAALLSRDEKMTEVFKKGGDVHSAVASEIFDIPEEMVDKEMRRKAKVINFGIMYGMGVNALKMNLETTREEARDFLKKYFERFFGLAEYLERVKKEARKKGYTKTLFSRRRYINGLGSSVPYIRAGAERMAINAPIQGTAADIIKYASVLVDNFLKREKKSNDAHLLLQVHDELVFEVADSFCDSFLISTTDIMEGVLKKEGHTEIPLKVNVEKGKVWGKMNKVK